MFHPIILFDGVCNFCNASVVFILRRDPRGRFRFAPQQSEAGRSLLARHGLDADSLGSLVLIEGDRVYIRSNAVLRIARRLRAPWPLAHLAVLIPHPLRDAAYQTIARNRYRWFGRRESCAVPLPEWRQRFLDEGTEDGR